MLQRAVVLTQDQLENPDVSQPHRWEHFKRHYLAEGDSWFTLAAVPGGNLLQELRLQQSTLIINTAYPGDTLSHIIDWRQNSRFVNMLAAERFAKKWDAILLSAGGNDLIDAAIAPHGILRTPSATAASVEDCIDGDNLQKFDRYVSVNLESVVALRDAPGSLNKGVPLYVHTYDYPTARPAPAKLVGIAGVAGPWLFRAYTEHDIPAHIWASLTDFLIDHLAAVLTNLTLPAFTVVDTRATLNRAAESSTGDSGDWLNEIHANREGRKKLAVKWASHLDS